MKGLILSGGKGSRLYPLTYTSAKQLVPVANKPVLFRVIEAIRDAGIREIGIVVGVDDNARQVREAVGRGGRWGVDVTFIPQEAPLGLAHAVKISQNFLGEDRFVMFLGDNVIQGGISPLIRQFEHSVWNSQIVLTRVEKPEQYGVAQVAEDGAIVRLIEKPKEPPSDLALVGIYMFDHHVFEAVHAIKPSWRGELEITDAIQWLVDNGYAVHPYVHRGWWIDTGAPIDMLAANDKVLEELRHEIKGFVDKESRVSDNVTVETGGRDHQQRGAGPGHHRRRHAHHQLLRGAVYLDLSPLPGGGQRDRALHRAGALADRGYPCARGRQPDRPPGGAVPLPLQAQSLQADAGRS
jgi:glucose-1-phosphate thymidylyltransferase